MKNLRKLIWISIVIIILIIIIISVLLFMITRNNNGVDTSEIDEFDNTLQDSGLYNFNKTIQPVKVRNNFYAVKSCVEKFYFTYSKLFNNQENNNYLIEGEALNFVEQEMSQNAQSIYNMLDDEYIQYTGITLENIITELPEINTNSIEIEKMYVSQQTRNTDVYFVYGNFRDEKTFENIEFSLIVKLDRLNKTFKILMQDYLEEKCPEIVIGSESPIAIGEEIENVGDNIFESQIISDERYATDLFNYYQKNILYNRSRAYELLNSEYKTQKFNSEDAFENYIQENLTKFAIAKIEKYEKTTNDDYTQYVCMDQNGRYYIFRENNIMDYTVILDTYTIDLPEFVEEYENASDEDKVLMNIQRFFDAIEDKDYDYAYDKLDETFKANNFATLESFEKYVRENFFEENTLSAGKAEKQGDVYLYNVTIDDGTGKSSNSKTTSFVMRLGEETDFVMSFGVE